MLNKNIKPSNWDKRNNVCLVNLLQFLVLSGDLHKGLGRGKGVNQRKTGPQKCDKWQKSLELRSKPLGVNKCLGPSFLLSDYQFTDQLTDQPTEP